MKHIIWKINHLCNFSCPYCFSGGQIQKEHPKTAIHSPEFISKQFAKYADKWHITLLGGEPFLYPKFVDLCQALTKNNHLSLITNLSTSNVEKFAQTVSPEKVFYIATTVHIEEREKHKNGIEKLIENYLVLKSKNFKIGCLYIAHPSLFNRIENDFMYFRNRGVDVSIKTFRGQYNGKNYPQDLTEKELEIMASLGMSKTEEKTATSQSTFTHNYCNFGYDSFIMDNTGKVKRCGTSSITYGNLLQGTFNPDTKPKPCTRKICNCPSHGMHGVKNINLIVPRFEWYCQLSKELCFAAANFIPHNYKKIKKNRS